MRLVLDQSDRRDEPDTAERIDGMTLRVRKLQYSAVAHKRRDNTVLACVSFRHRTSVTVDDHAVLLSCLRTSYKSGVTEKQFTGGTVLLATSGSFRLKTVDCELSTLRLMKLGLNIGYFGTAISDNFALISAAEEMGYDSVWTAEAYGADALTPLAWIAARTERIKVGSAVFQMPARTPAMTAMTATTLDIMSNGRFLLGLGVSGPQVVEGWHGKPFGKPLQITREYVAILRQIFARDHPVEYDGTYYQLPYQGEDATGLGKPLKIMMKPKNPNMPILIAAIGPKNVQLTAEIADGWLPVFFSPERSASIYQPLLDAGFGLSGESDKAKRFEIVPTVSAIVTDDMDAGRLQMKPFLALYIGGMGAKGRNFYNDLACRYGYETEAEHIQDLYLAGKKMEATLAVPDALVDEVCIVGSSSQIKDRLEVWKDAGVSTLNIATTDINTLRTIAEHVG